jgi:FkbM family methyltransferase
MSSGLFRALAAGEFSRVASALVRRVRDPFGANDPNRFLQKVPGVIHVGAHGGQERDLYAKFDLRVLWVEAIPHVYEYLSEQIKPFPRQRAENRLITDRDGAEYLFHVASNHGMSSSILAPDRHRELWPDVSFDTQISLRSVTLDSLLEEIGAEPDDYGALVMDTQGSELLVLKGAGKLLGRITYVKTEATDFESYSGCAKADELERFLSDFGFELIRRDTIAEKEGVGGYYDLLFRKSFPKPTSTKRQH